MSGCGGLFSGKPMALGPSGEAQETCSHLLSTGIFLLQAVRESFGSRLPDILIGSFPRAREIEEGWLIAQN